MVKQLKWKLFQAGHKPWFETFLTFIVIIKRRIRTLERSVVNQMPREKCEWKDLFLMSNLTNAVV